MKSTLLVLATLILLGALQGLCAEEEVPLVDPAVETPFEKQPETKATLVGHHAPPGKTSIKIPAQSGVKMTPATGLRSDWSAHDVVKLEIFNPSDKHQRIYIQVRDSDNSANYWSWHNRYAAVAPGKNLVQFAVADIWRGEFLRRDAPGNVNPKDIQILYISAMEKEGEIFITRMTFGKFAVQKVDVPGLKAFDVECSSAPGFPGFISLTEKDTYSKEKKYGWTKTTFANANNPGICIRLHPDNLFKDWLSCCDAELAVDLPNGKYRVRMQLEDPGAWEFVQNYRKRTVSAEGKVVLDESMSGEQFLKSFFRHQDTEDMPHEDPFEKYDEARHPWKEFDVEVADGQLNLALQSPDTYGATLSALVISPLEHEEAAKKFMAWVKEARRFDWAQRWKGISKPPAAPNFSGRMAAEAASHGYALFATSPYVTPAYDHVPTDAEELKELSITAAQGEFEPAVFGLRPAKALGKVDVAVSALKNEAGQQIPKENVTVRVGRYRVARYQGDQSGMYHVREKQLSLFNRSEAEVLRCDDGMARRFWVTVKAPEGAKAGKYSGTVTVSAEKGSQRTIPLHVTVLPFALPDPEHLFAVYGVGVLPLPYQYEEIRKDMRRRLDIVYEDVRDHGMTYMMENVARIDFKDGKAIVANVDEVDRDYALRRKMGFKDGVAGVDAGCTVDQLAVDGTIRGLPRRKFIEGWHKTITDTFKEKGWPHPFFRYGDEPNLPELLKKLVAINNACHEVSPDIWLGIAYHIQPQVKESFELAATLDVHELKEFCPVSDFELAKKRAKFLMHCNVGPGRLAYGLKEWRATIDKKTDGCVTYAYHGSNVDIYYALDHREDDYLMAPQRMDGHPATTAWWELTREGTDDYRYARALDNLVKAGTAKAEVLENAKLLLNEAYEIGGTKQHWTAAPVAPAIQWREKAQKVLAAAAQ
ncbi:MAG TPA: hypothetical protein VEJ63_13865 [Planctomycetota bacterium]|nr:hypothetical protein [Planctomycetota bacterium]